MQQSIDITTEQSFRYMELTDANIWISNNASTRQVIANQVTYISSINYWQQYMLKVKYFNDVTYVFMKILRKNLLSMK